jgi:hypothetical protein
MAAHTSCCARAPAWIGRYGVPHFWLLFPAVGMLTPSTKVKVLSKPQPILAPPARLHYSQCKLGFDSPQSMQCQTARILLLFVLVGTILPAALQATVTPQHACCRRQQAHHCHDAADIHSKEPVVSNTGCRQGDCSRTVTTPRWAHPQPQASAISSELARDAFLEAHNAVVFARFLASLSTRAPPQLSIG